MTHNEKVERFIGEMTQRGFSQYTAAPPGWRMAWSLGLEVPPPHFLGFGPLFLTGLFIWVPGMWLLMTLAWSYSVSAAVATGMLFGVCYAALYKRSAAMIGLPSWDCYPP